MNEKIKVGIVGYGNLGKGVQAAIKQNADMELVGVFTRRDPASLELAEAGPAVYRYDEIVGMKDKIDVLVLCGGSATDLPQMTPQLARDFNVIDSFDTHAKIPEHFAAVDEAATAGNKVAVVLLYTNGDSGFLSKCNDENANATSPVSSL